jgi:V/A-type H+/Na+-transporting ATPase subunit E
VAYENLLKSVEESAQERELELREKAQNTVLELKAEALKQAEKIRSGLLDDATRSATVERNKLMYLTKAESKERQITTREKIYSQAFASAEKRLAQLRKEPGYPEIFKKLATEAIGSAGLERCVVHIDKLDEKLCKKVMTTLNHSCEIVPDLQTVGGLVVNSSDGLITFSNTVESRLERGKERLRLEIYSVLSGG